MVISHYAESKCICLLSLLIATFLCASDRNSALKSSEGSNFALGKRVRVSTNDAEEKYAGAGSHFEAITDGSLSYRCKPAGEVRKSDGDHGGCVGWVNDTYNEELVVTVKIDLEEPIHIRKIRYTMGNCFRAATWGADSMTTPLGTVQCNARDAAGCAWTEQDGNITASTIEIVLKKTRTSYATDWLFIGEIEVIGNVDSRSGVAPMLSENVHSNVLESGLLNESVTAKEPIKKSLDENSSPSEAHKQKQSRSCDESVSTLSKTTVPDSINAMCAMLNKMRTWTGKNGTKINAKFVSVSDDGNAVTFEKEDGTTIQTEIARLASDDQKMVAGMAQLKLDLEKEKEWRYLQALQERYPFKLKNGEAVERSVAADSWFICSKKLKGEEEKITSFGFIDQGITNEVQSLTGSALKIVLTPGKKQQLLWQEQSFVILVNGREIDHFKTTADYCGRGLKTVSEKEKNDALKWLRFKRYAEKQRRFSLADQKALKALTRQICAHPFVLKAGEPMQRGINVGGWIIQNAKLNALHQTLTADSISIFYEGVTNTLLAAGAGKLQLHFDDKSVLSKPIEVNNIAIKKNKDTDGSDVISYYMVDDLIYEDDNEKMAILFLDNVDGNNVVRILKYAVVWDDQPFVIMCNGKESGRFQTTADYQKRGVRILPFSLSLKIRKDNPD